MSSPRSRSLTETRMDRVLVFASTIAASYGTFSAADILGRSRKLPLPDARHELMTQLWESGLTLAEIGRLLKKHHTTVLHGVRRVLGSEYKAISQGRSQ